MNTNNDFLPDSEDKKATAEFQNEDESILSEDVLKDATGGIDPSGSYHDQGNTDFEHGRIIGF